MIHDQDAGSCLLHVLDIASASPTFCAMTAEMPEALRCWGWEPESSGVAFMEWALLAPATLEMMLDQIKYKG